MEGSCWRNYSIFDSTRLLEAVLKWPCNGRIAKPTRAMESCRTSATKRHDTRWPLRRNWYYPGRQDLRVFSQWGVPWLPKRMQCRHGGTRPRLVRCIARVVRRAQQRAVMMLEVDVVEVTAKDLRQWAKGGDSREEVD